VCVDGECDAREERVALPLLIICAGRVVNSVHVIWDATTPVDRAAVDRMLPVPTDCVRAVWMEAWVTCPQRINVARIGDGDGCLDGCIGAVHGASTLHTSVRAMAVGMDAWVMSTAHQRTRIGDDDERARGSQR
jgi:hypothetical protein